MDSGYALWGMNAGPLVNTSGVTRHAAVAVGAGTEVQLFNSSSVGRTPADTVKIVTITNRQGAGATFYVGGIGQSAANGLGIEVKAGDPTLVLEIKSSALPTNLYAYNLSGVATTAYITQWG